MLLTGNRFISRQNNVIRLGSADKVSARLELNGFASLFAADDYQPADNRINPLFAGSDSVP